MNLFRDTLDSRWEEYIITYPSLTSMTNFRRTTGFVRPECPSNSVRTASVIGISTILPCGRHFRATFEVQSTGRRHAVFTATVRRRCATGATVRATVICRRSPTVRAAAEVTVSAVDSWWNGGRISHGGRRLHRKSRRIEGAPLIVGTESHGDAVGTAAEFQHPTRYYVSENKHACHHHHGVILSGVGRCVEAHTTSSNV